ncbi:hypothetical protein BD779DRAFT_1470977 [Infundibulicybe gibba]|nr:hypothetical protein BD779DRAFT_1470977 [Infundibulicybe gibba]
MFSDNVSTRSTSPLLPSPPSSPPQQRFLAAYQTIKQEEMRKSLGIVADPLEAIRRSEILPHLSGRPIPGRRCWRLNPSAERASGEGGAMLGRFGVGEAVRWIVDALRLVCNHTLQADKTAVNTAPWHPFTPPAMTYVPYWVPLKTNEWPAVYVQWMGQPNALGMVIGERMWGVRWRRAC